MAESIESLKMDVVSAQLRAKTAEQQRDENADIIAKWRLRAETAEEQRDLLWGEAQRVMNKSNAADDTWVQVPKSCLDELGQALMHTSGEA